MKKWGKADAGFEYRNEMLKQMGRNKGRWRETRQQCDSLFRNIRYRLYL